MKTKILVTGSEGLIGRHLCPLLKDRNCEIIPLDIALSGGQKKDICDDTSLHKVISGCHGIIHLAAVSRVVWAQQYPTRCWETNAMASERLLQTALNQSVQPWVLLASSREIYGEASVLPVRDNTTPKPINIYGKSKLYMEEAALSARTKGLTIAIARLANVYGSIFDHHDRVLPAFCRAAAEGKPLRVDGLNNTFDFTHVEDTVAGLILMVEKLESGVRDLPPLHLLPGIPTTLEEAAKMAIAAANSSSKIITAPSRNYDVSRFYGLAYEAEQRLNWQAKITPNQGIKMLVDKFQNNLMGVTA